MSRESQSVADTGDEALQEGAPPPCVMSFNASDPTGAAGVSGDIATLSAMGTYALPVVCTILMRDTAEVFEQHCLDADTVVEQARGVLEDVEVAAFKVGFLGSAENVSAVAEVLSDYPDVPLVAYLPSTGWMEEDESQAYAEAFRDLILPQTELLVGSHQVLCELLLPDWDAERPASAREIAVAAAERGTQLVLVTSMALPEQWIDNVLASAQGAITGERFERFEATFLGAGETLSASMAGLLACGADVASSCGEALAFLDQALDSGFRPGMGHVVPDRFFWAQAPEEGEEGEPQTEGSDLANDTPTPGSRRIH